MTKLKDLKGLSGCHIELMEYTGGKYYVKKTSSSINYNDRLNKQVEKQNNFFSDLAKAPTVIETGTDDSGLFFCIMEYIHGVSFAEFLKLYPFKDCLSIFERLLHLVFSRKEQLNEGQMSELNIQKKLEELSSKQIGHEVLLTRLKNTIPSSLLFTPTHGDFTFENVLINQNNEIYLIDFLDSFVDNTFIDLAKLNQELSLRWSVRKDTSDTDVIIKYQKFNKVFVDQCNIHNIDQQTLLYFSILTLLRILPYTKDLKERSIIYQKLDLWQKELQ